MGIHKSLVTRGKLARHRNVLTRYEKITRLEEEEKWKDGNSVFGIQKVRNILHRAKKVKKEAVAEGAEAATAAAPGAATAPSGAPATGAKGTPSLAGGKGAAAPTAGAKSGAPAAKPAAKK
jgi:small basic protein (TIGR04137 family)